MGHKQCTTREVHQITTLTALGGQKMCQDFKDRNSLCLGMLPGNIQWSQEQDYVITVTTIFAIKVAVIVTFIIGT